MKRKPQSMTAGAVILFISALTVKVIGALFKIPLTNRIGGIGMGYYMTAYSVFNPIYAVSAAGLPSAISRVGAKLNATWRGNISDRRFLFISCVTFLPISLALSAAMYLFAVPAAAIVGNIESYLAIRSIAPAVFFCCLSAVVRGLCEGRRDMLPTAVTQCTEAVIKLSAGLYLVEKCIASNPAATGLQLACAALWGVTLSTVVGSVLMLALGFPAKDDDTAKLLHIPTKKLCAELISAAIPVCLAALITNVTTMIDLFTVMNRLGAVMQQSGEAVISSHPAVALCELSPDEIPNFLFGSYTALALTVFHLVPAVITPIGVSALPSVCALYTAGHTRQTRIAVCAVLKAAACLAVPAGIGIFALGEPILRFLFSGNEREIIVAAGILRPLGIASAFSAMSFPVNSLLQAVGRPYVPARLMVFGALIKLISNLVLLSVPDINIDGAAWGTLLCYAFMMIRASDILMREICSPISLVSIFAKPFFGGILCAFSAKKSLGFLTRQLSLSAALITAICVGGTVYLVFLLVLGVFDTEEKNILFKKLKKT